MRILCPSKLWSARVLATFRGTLARRSRRLVLLVGTIFVSSAAQQAYAFTFFGVGAGRNTCSNYLKAAQGVEPDSGKLIHCDIGACLSQNRGYEQWIYGAVTALNYASAMSGNKLPDVKIDVEMLNWVRNWCGAHPDSKVFEAVERYMSERWAQARRTANAAVAPSDANSQASSAPSTPPSAVGSTEETYVSVSFQPNVSETDIQAFLQAYGIARIEGPNADGLYKLRLSGSLPPDQFKQFLDSMKSQIKIIKVAQPG